MAAKRKNWLKEKKKIIEHLIESAERELSLPEKVRAYILLKEILFWEEVIKEAQEKQKILRNLLSFIPNKKG